MVWYVMQISTNNFYIETTTRFTLPDEKELPAIDTVAYVYITYKDVMSINLGSGEIMTVLQCNVSHIFRKKSITCMFCIPKISLKCQVHHTLR